MELASRLRVLEQHRHSLAIDHGDIGRLVTIEIAYGKRGCALEAPEAAG